LVLHFKDEEHGSSNYRKNYCTHKEKYTMRRLAFAIVALMSFICTMSVSAQKDVKVRFGVEGGFNMTKWNGEVLPHYDLAGIGEIPRILDDASIQCGFHAGVLADLVIQDHWSIQPEILFTMEGSNLSTSLEGDSLGLSSESQKVKAFYIRIPILVYYNFTNIGPGQLSPGLGFFFAGGVAGEAFEGDSPLLDEFDWGLNVKVAYELQKYAPGLFLSAGFSQGFSTSKSTGMNVTVGYKFQYAKFLKRAYNTGILEYNP
jgi:hypothetical protein